MSMHPPKFSEVADPGPWKLSSRPITMFAAVAVVGASLWVTGLMMDPIRGWSAYLINFLFVTFLAVSGVFFTALQYTTNAIWSPAIRRIPEGLTKALPLAIIFVLGFWVAVPKLYSWYGTGWVNAEGLTRAVARSKVTWLSQPFFTLRNIVFVAIWCLFGWAIVKNSLRQDKGDMPGLSKTNTKLSIAFMILFALSFSLFSFDHVMSLEPNWFSTMFGVYAFIGMFQSGIALVAIIAIIMRKQGALPINITGHIRDLGGFVFAMSVFFSYIGFCQFMLIWYANLPEETFYYLKRTHGGWWFPLVLIALFKFILPFILLMSGDSKRNEKLLMTISFGILLGQWIDLYWMIMPTHYAGSSLPGIAEVGGLLFFVGLFAIPVVKFYRTHSLLAKGDPKIMTSLNWEG